MCGVVDAASVMASLRGVREACRPYGLEVSRRRRPPYYWVVFRPLTGYNVAVIDIRRIPSDGVDEMVASWALSEAFES